LSEEARRRAGADGQSEGGEEEGSSRQYALVIVQP
jgi:hypothetical protein